MVCIWNRQDITKTQKQSGIASSDRGLRFVVIIRLRLHLETDISLCIYTDAKFSKYFTEYNSYFQK